VLEVRDLGLQPVRPFARRSRRHQVYRVRLSVNGAHLPTQRKQGDGLRAITASEVYRDPWSSLRQASQLFRSSEQVSRWSS